MKRWAWLVVASTAAFVTALAVSTAGATGLDWWSREGTVRWADGLADGTHVYLDAVQISKIRGQQSPAYIVIEECLSPQDKLIVLTQPSPELRVGQTVDIEGDLTTIDFGVRALTNVTVWGYTDNLGMILYHVPFLKGFLSPFPWDYKIDLTLSPAVARDSETPSPPGEVTTDSTVEVSFCTTVSDAKAKSVGTVVELRCHPVATGGTGSFVLGDDDDTDTLVVNYTGTISQTSHILSITGTIDTTDEVDS